MTTNDDLDPRHRVCAVCARVLDVSEGRGWRHTVDITDHIAVPVLASDVRVDWRCDFCFAAELGYLVPANDFRLSGPVEYGSIGAWHACSRCAALIRVNDWRSLTTRAIRAYVERNGPISPEVVNDVRRAYAKLRTEINGPLRKLTSPQ